MKKKKYRTKFLGFLGMVSLCMVCVFTVLLIPKQPDLSILSITKNMKHADQLSALDRISYFPCLLFVLLRFRVIRHGEYTLPQSLNGFQILDIIWNQRHKLHKFTIQEGLSVYQIKAKLESEIKFDGPVPAIEEGSVVATSYMYTAGTNRQKFVRFMQEQSRKIKDAIWADGTTWADQNEWVTFASILEKEGLDYEDKVQIAGVLINRLKKKIPLQVDATLLYVKTGGKYDARITMDELLCKKFDNHVPYSNPYNTYLFRGLPPGPIASPGIDSLKIAAKPIPSPYLYYRRVGNKHVFSKNFQQHIAAGR